MKKVTINKYIFAISSMLVMACQVEISSKSVPVPPSYAEIEAGYKIQGGAYNTIIDKSKIEDVCSADVGTYLDMDIKIKNTGNSNLSLIGNDNIKLSGSNLYFSVKNYPDKQILTPADETVFTIRFNPRSSGVFDCDIMIINSSKNAPDFSFVISGKSGLTPPVASISLDNNDDITLSVELLPGAVKYDIYCGEDGIFDNASKITPEPIVNKTDQKINFLRVINGLSEGELYYFLVVVNSGGDEESIALNATKITSPVSVIVTPVSSYKIDISWENKPGVVEYQIKLFEKSNDTLVEEKTIQGTSYSPIGLKPNTEYYAVLQAINNEKNLIGKENKTASSWTLLPTPPAPAITARYASAIKLSLPAAPAGVTSFDIYYSTGSTFDAAIKHNAAPVPAGSDYTVDRLEENTPYHFWLVGINENTHSEPSLPAEGTTISAGITVRPPQNPADPVITGLPAIIRKLDAAGKVNAAPVILSTESGYDSYEWHIDGVKMAEGNPWTFIGCYDLPIGTHTVTVIVTKDDKPYSKYEKFEVVNK